MAGEYKKKKKVEILKNPAIKESDLAWKLAVDSRKYRATCTEEICKVGI